MPDRKQFQNVPPVSTELKDALKSAGQRQVTEEELREQRISFAFGNAPFDATEITKESVRCASKHIRLLT
ncbi:MAG: hypothetical protein ACRD1Y_12320 [Terriglobales bacterium]